MAGYKFKIGDEVILSEWTDFTLLFFSPQMAPLIGSRFILRERRGDNPEGSWYVRGQDALGNSYLWSWLESAMTLVSADRTTPVSPIQPNTDERPEWMISRTVGIAPGHCVCDLPTTGEYACKFHRTD